MLQVILRFVRPLSDSGSFFFALSNLLSFLFSFAALVRSRWPLAASLRFRRRALSSAVVALVLNAVGFASFAFVKKTCLSSCARFKIKGRVLLGDGERDEEDDELREDEDERDTERRFAGDGTMANDEVSCPAICINLAYNTENRLLELQLECVICNYLKTRNSSWLLFADDDIFLWLFAPDAILVTAVRRSVQVDNVSISWNKIMSRQQSPKSIHRSDCTCHDAAATPGEENDVFPATCASAAIDEVTAVWASGERATVEVESVALATDAPVSGGQVNDAANDVPESGAGMGVVGNDAVSGEETWPASVGVRQATGLVTDVWAESEDCPLS